jgi:hypothetical protein
VASGAASEEGDSVEVGVDSVGVDSVGGASDSVVASLASGAAGCSGSSKDDEKRTKKDWVQLRFLI